MDLVPLSPGSDALQSIGRSRKKISRVSRRSFTPMSNQKAFTVGMEGLKEEKLEGRPYLFI